MSGSSPSKQADSEPAPAPQVFAVASGKGGVGKTSLVANLGICLAALGRRVCVFDADTNLANINILLGLTPRYTLEHLLNGERDLDGLLLTAPGPMHIVPAASGIADLVSLGPAQRRRLLDALRELERQHDYLLIDCAAGVGETLVSLLLSAPRVVLVITSEPTSLTDAYSLLKVLRARGLRRPVYALVNRARTRDQALAVYQRFKQAAGRFIHMEVHSLGYVLADEAMADAVHRQMPLVTTHPDSPAARCLAALARVIDRRFRDGKGAERLSELWGELLQDLPEDEAVRGEGAVSEPTQGDPLQSLGCHVTAVVKSGNAQELQVLAAGVGALQERLQVALELSLSVDASSPAEVGADAVYRREEPPAGEALRESSINDAEKAGLLRARSNAGRLDMMS